MELPASPRLEFRRWREEDLPLALELWGDPRVTRLTDARPSLDQDQVETRLREEIELERRHGLQYWPAFLRESGDFVGCCGLRPREGEPCVFELGFHLRARFWGRGLATEAARAVVRHAFEARGAEALFAGHHPDNRASARVLEKLGFRRTHDELYPPTGLLHPSYRLEAGSSRD